MGCWKGMVRGGVCGTGSSSVNWLTRADSSKEGLAQCLREICNNTLDMAWDRRLSGRRKTVGLLRQPRS